MSTRYLSSVDTSSESRDCFLTSLTLIYPTVNKWGVFRGQERLGTTLQDRASGQDCRTGHQGKGQKCQQKPGPKDLKDP